MIKTLAVQKMLQNPSEKEEMKDENRLMNKKSLPCGKCGRNCREKMETRKKNRKIIKNRLFSETVKKW